MLTEDSIGKYYTDECGGVGKILSKTVIGRKDYFLWIFKDELFLVDSFGDFPKIVNNYVNENNWMSLITEVTLDNCENHSIVTDIRGDNDYSLTIDEIKYGKM